MKVLLVATNRMTTPFPVYPIGLDYVATALEGRHDVRLLDCACEHADRVLADLCRDWQPELVGLSIRNIDNVEADAPLGFLTEIERIAGVVRSTCAARLVLGGPGFSIFSQALMRRLAADFGIIGEGERLAELVAALASGTFSPATAIPGLLVGAGCTTPPAPWLGPQRRTLMAPATVAHYLRRGGMLNVQTKRGCPFRCSYCTYPAIEGRRQRLRDPEHVAREWRELVNAGARFIYVTDAVFNSHVPHNLAVARALHAQGLATPWGGFFAPVRPQPGYYARLRDAGLSHVELGTESFSPAMLEAYRKPFTVEHALAAHAEAKACGLHVAHYLLLGGPGETVDTVNETLDRCDAIADAALFFFCGVRLYPGTALHARAIREGQISADDDLLEPHFYTPAAIGLATIRTMVHQRARGRRHWVQGSGSDEMAAVLARMYERGRTGPLWDRLVEAP